MTRARPAAALDVYLFPAVVGGGLGDIEEVLAAGRHLARAGHRLLLYRARPLPPQVEGPWRWPTSGRLTRLAPEGARALTLSAGWGVACAPARPEPYGRAGVWSAESAAVEAAYGASSVLHVSLEEFARTLTSRAQTAERWREGGVPVREIRRRLRSLEGQQEAERFHREYRKFRGFDRPNVLHVYAGFSRSRSFAAEFPEAVQTGPLAPDWAPPRRRDERRRGGRAGPRWLWYASPSSSARLVERIDSACSRARASLAIDVRSPHPLRLPRRSFIRWRTLPPTTPARWSTRFYRAELRIVTGSRTLLEALALGAPFLYFNGITGEGRRSRRHRPEKIDALLEVWRRAGVDTWIRRDLASFSRGRNVGPILRRAASAAFAARFPNKTAGVGFHTPYRSVGELLDTVAKAHAQGLAPSEEIVARARSRTL